MNDRPSNPLKRLAWFLGWDTTPDDQIPDPESRRNAALSAPHPAWTEGLLDHQATPATFHPVEREGYSFYVVVPATEVEGLCEAFESWEREGYVPERVAIKWHQSGPLLIAELPEPVTIQQAFDLLGWVPFHGSNHWNERDVRLFALHRDSNLSFYAMVEPGCEFMIGRFRNYQAFCVHIAGVWKLPTMMVEHQDAPQRLSYNEALETWGLHELALLEHTRNTVGLKLAMPPKTLRLEGPIG